MKLRWRGSRPTQERNATPDPVSAAVWEDELFTGSTTAAPVINAPRAGDVVAPPAA